ncbi:MAG: MFS transporter [Clostridiales bacterium]|jgi:sugar phosphate permease|nr:MFS transporter [Clostridiales bacterium]
MDLAKKSKSKAILSAIGAIMIFTFSTGPFSMMSLYWEPISKEIGTTVGALSISLSLATAVAVVASLTIGRVLKVLSPKIMIIVAGICIFAFQFAVSVSTSIIPIYIVALLNGIGTVWGGMAMSQIVISQWFEKARATVMSLCMVVLGVVLTVVIPIAGNLVAQIGYRPVVLAVGIIGGAGVIIGAFLIAGPPEKYGLKPYGAGEINQSAGAEAQAMPPSLPFDKIIKNASFWSVVIIAACGSLVAQGFNSQAVVVFGSFGLDAVTAAYAFAIFSMIGLPCQFTFGFLCDKIGPKLTMAIAGCIWAVVLFLGFIWNGFAGAVIFALGMAAGGGLGGLYGPNMATRLFGVASAGDMIGFITVGSSLGATIGPLIFGFIYDAFGNYSAALIAMGVIVLICIALNFWLNNKQNIDKLKEQIALESAT